MKWIPQNPRKTPILIDTCPTSNTFTTEKHYIDIPFSNRVRINLVSVSAKYAGVYEFTMYILDAQDIKLFLLGKGNLYYINESINRNGNSKISYIHDGQEKITIRVYIYNRTGTARDFNVAVNYDKEKEEGS